LSKKVDEKDKQMSKQNIKIQLPQVPEKYQKLCNLQYVRDEQARKEVMDIIDELGSIEELVLEKTGGHDLSVRFKGRQLVKICPLSKAWSASIQGSKIQRYSKDQVLEQVKKLMESPKSTSTNSDLIKKLEERIKKLSHKSKGISLKGVDLTKDVELWI
jgi:hypothetical protein